MARKSPSSAALAFRPRRGRKSLIEWTDPSKQAHVLDWRQRAHGFGLDVDEREDTEERQLFPVSADFLLHEVLLP